MASSTSNTKQNVCYEDLLAVGHLHHTNCVIIQIRIVTAIVVVLFQYYRGNDEDGIARCGVVGGCDVRKSYGTIPVEFDRHVR